MAVLYQLWTIITSKISLLMEQLVINKRTNLWHSEEVWALTSPTFNLPAKVVVVDPNSNNNLPMVVMSSPRQPMVSTPQCSNQLWEVTLKTSSRVVIITLEVVPLPTKWITFNLCASLILAAVEITILTLGTGAASMGRAAWVAYLKATLLEEASCLD